MLGLHKQLVSFNLDSSSHIYHYFGECLGFFPIRCANGEIDAADKGFKNEITL